MAWAIFYNSADLAVLGPAMQRLQAGGGGIVNADRNAFRTMWNAGLSTWQTAPVAPVGMQQGDSDTRILACGIATRAAFVALLRKYANSPLGSTYLLALARDMERPSGGRDPWP